MVRFSKKELAKSQALFREIEASQKRFNKQRKKKRKKKRSLAKQARPLQSPITKAKAKTKAKQKDQFSKRERRNLKAQQAKEAKRQEFVKRKQAKQRKKWLEEGNYGKAYNIDVQKIEARLVAQRLVYIGDSDLGNELVSFIFINMRAYNPRINNRDEYYEQLLLEQTTPAHVEKILYDILNQSHFDRLIDELIKDLKRAGKVISEDDISQDNDSLGDDELDDLIDELIMETL